jgi:branched-chain amino acid transport system permease protein
MTFGHSIALVAAMVIGGAGSIVGSILGGAYYVLVPQLTNAVDPNLTALLQGAILLIVLFLLPGGLVSLPRALTRGRRRSGPQRGTDAPGPERGTAAPPTTPSSTPGSGTAAEEPETERQGHA